MSVGEPLVFNVSKAWLKFLVRMEPAWGRKGQAERKCDPEATLPGGPDPASSRRLRSGHAQGQRVPALGQRPQHWEGASPSLLLSVLTAPSLQTSVQLCVLLLPTRLLHSTACPWPSARSSPLGVWGQVALPVVGAAPVSVPGWPLCCVTPPAVIPMAAPPQAVPTPLQALATSLARLVS